VVVANFAHEARSAYRIGFPRPRTWRLRLNTDWQGYSDDFQDFASHDIEAVEQECDGMAWSAEVALGAYSALIFSQDGRGVG
jgi:1,4-alpha-glucan branching enzyme